VVDLDFLSSVSEGGGIVSFLFFLGCWEPVEWFGCVVEGGLALEPVQERL
jgi:hypothetical protein